MVDELGVPWPLRDRGKLLPPAPELGLGEAEGSSSGFLGPQKTT